MLISWSSDILSSLACPAPASNVEKADCIPMDPRYDKEIVPLKKHIHCNCETAEHKDNLCDVHKEPEEYLESNSFTIQSSLKVGGYEEVKDTDVAHCSPHCGLRR